VEDMCYEILRVLRDTKRRATWRTCAMRDSMGSDRKVAPSDRKVAPMKQITLRHHPEAVPAEVPACPIFVWEIYPRGWRMDPPRSAKVASLA
jgi:hypothetical protein